MKVSDGDLIRNATGDWGCPNCWESKMGCVTPLDHVCPICNVTLEWTSEQLKLSEQFAPFRRLQIEAQDRSQP